MRAKSLSSSGLTAAADASRARRAPTDIPALAAVDASRARRAPTGIPALAAADASRARRAPTGIPALATIVGRRMASVELVVVLRAEFVNGVDENAKVRRIDVGCNSVSEIEHVPRPMAVTGKRISYALPYNFGALA